MNRMSFPFPIFIGNNLCYRRKLIIVKVQPAVGFSEVVEGNQKDFNGQGSEGSILLVLTAYIIFGFVND